MTSLTTVVSQIRKYCPPKTNQQRLEQLTQERFLSLTITGIAMVALYWIGIIPAMVLDLVTGRKPSSLSTLIANRIVHQLTSTKNTLVGKLPASLQKNWKSLALTTVIVSGAALLVYLRAPNPTENTILTIKNLLVVAAVGVPTAAIAKLRDLQTKKALREAAAAEVKVMETEQKIASLLEQQAIVAVDELKAETDLTHLSQKDIPLDYLNDFPLLKRVVETQKAIHSKQLMSHLKIFNAREDANTALETLLQEVNLPNKLRDKASQSEKEIQTSLNAFAKLIERLTRCAAEMKNLESKLTTLYTTLQELKIEAEKLRAKAPKITQEI